MEITARDVLEITWRFLVLGLLVVATGVVFQNCSADEVTVQQTDSVDIGSDGPVLPDGCVDFGDYIQCGYFDDYDDSVVVHRGAMIKVYRVTDDEAGVVCWISDDGSMDCLPIEQTRLDR